MEGRKEMAEYGWDSGCGEAAKELV